MIFADKLIALRKKAGWSQEELAQQLNVSRQSVSKWEGAQSVPDLDKIVQLSRIFGVSTDYLLKDELEEQEPAPSLPEQPQRRRVSMEEASRYLELRRAAAPRLALATFLCVISTHCADPARRTERIYRPHHGKCSGWYWPQRTDRSGRRRGRNFPDVRRKGKGILVSGNRAV